jgi:hypothetical protein
MTDRRSETIGSNRALTVGAIYRESHAKKGGLRLPTNYATNRTRDPRDAPDRQHDRLLINPDPEDSLPHQNPKCFSPLRTAIFLEEYIPDNHLCLFPILRAA